MDQRIRTSYVPYTTDELQPSTISVIEAELEQLYGDYSSEKLPKEDRDVSSSEEKTPRALFKKQLKTTSSTQTDDPTTSSQGDAGGDSWRTNEKINLKFFIEIFSGTGGLSGAVKAGGVLIYTFDIKKCKKGNILNKDTYRTIRGLIKSKNCLGVWFGMPCGTFSTARDHVKTDGSEPRRIRGTTPETVLKPEKYCTSNERSHVINGNRVLYRMLDIIRLCIAEKVPWYIENPRRSRLWMVPQIAVLAQLSEAKFCQFDYCQFGTDYQKETIILAWNNPLFYENHMTCTSKWIGKFPKRCKSPCSKTGEHHVVLKGVDDDKQKYKTATACEYPRELRILGKIDHSKCNRPTQRTEDE